jgi:hypothetical protein
MIVVDMLVLRLTTPEKMNGRKPEAMWLLGSEVEVGDVADGMLPDSLYLWEPVWYCPSIGEVSQLLIVWRGGQRG